ncbi:MAG: AAA family ATPase [Campylobacterales bacterium]
MVTGEYAMARELFFDERVGDAYYINLVGLTESMANLMELLEKPLKMILLYGKPGTGKSMMLRKVYEELKERRPIYLFETPSFDELHDLKRIYSDITGKKAPTTRSFTKLLEEIKAELPADRAIILLDEAQLYPVEKMEVFRLLADTRIFKFVIVVHKTASEELLAMEQFKTRIWEMIELKSLNLEETKVFIEKKLIKNNLYQLLGAFRPRNYKLIHKLTGGNLRNINKLMYKLFDIYDYFDATAPHKINRAKIENKYIEIAAMDTRMDE